MCISSLAPFGFVIFHSKDIDWPVFKEQMETVIRHGFTFASNVKIETKDGFRLPRAAQWTKSLRCHTTIRDNRAISKGLPLDAFLYLAGKVLQSWYVSRSFVRIREQENQAEQVDETGPLKIDIRHNSAGTVYTVGATGCILGHGRLHSQGRMRHLEQLHAEAGRSQTSDDERDTTWPTNPRAFQIKTRPLDNERGTGCVAIGQK